MASNDNVKDIFKDLDKYVRQNYPQAYIYYAMGKVFNWPPHIVDELDVDLCSILLLIDEKVNARESVDGQVVQEKPKPSFPEEWKDMKVEDIIKTEEFQKKIEENEVIFKVMKRKENVK